MTLKPLITVATLTMSCVGAFASTASVNGQPHSSHMILLGLGMMAVIVWRRFKSDNA